MSNLYYLLNSVPTIARVNITNLPILNIDYYDAILIRYMLDMEHNKHNKLSPNSIYIWNNVRSKYVSMIKHPEIFPGDVLSEHPLFEYVSYSQCRKYNTMCEINTSNMSAIIALI
jgi:hypothetical protein